LGWFLHSLLAIAATRALEAHFEGRVMWLDCGPNTAHAIQARLAAALGVALEQSQDLQVRADALDRALRQQPSMLVVLDDIRRRHLQDFTALKPPCPPCALLVTSRRTDLPLPDQAVRRLPTLTPERSRDLLSILLPAEWAATEPQAVADIAALLEHIPLALAARRARRIAQRRDHQKRPLDALLKELQARRIQILNQGQDPTRPDLSVVITFDASYEDLGGQDQARLCRLGVFARSKFEFPAIQAVWQDDEKETRQALMRLENAGLVEEIDIVGLAQRNPPLAARLERALSALRPGRPGQGIAGGQPGHCARAARIGRHRRGNRSGAAGNSGDAGGHCPAQGPSRRRGRGAGRPARSVARRCCARLEQDRFVTFALSRLS